MVEVFAAKGPLAGRRIELPEDQVDAATAEGGWALKLEPGVQLLADPGAPYSKSWKIPGYSEADLAPFVEKGPEPPAKTTDIKEGQAKTTDAKTATSSAGSTSTRAAPVSGKEPAEETNGDKAAAEDKASTTTKTSQK